MQRYMVLLFSILVFSAIGLCATGLTAAEPQAKPAAPVPMNDLEKEFTASLTGAELVGFSMRDDAQEGKVTPDRYSIEEIEKVDATHWRIKAGIPVGQVVLVFPLLLEVQWAGDTPVITLTDFAVGPLGTFTARVLFYRGRYAGTWSHGTKNGGNAVGGQIFGRVIPKGAKAEPSPDKPATDRAPAKDAAKASKK